MQSESFEVQFTLSPSDLRSFRWFQFRKSWLGLSLFIVAIFLVFLFNLYEREIFDVFRGAGLSAENASVLVGWTPFFLLASLLLGLIVYRQSRATSLGSRRPVYLPQQFTVSPEGLHVVREGIVGDVAWRAVSRIRVRDKQTYIYLDDMHAYIVPMRAFESAKSFKTFNDAVQRYFVASRPALG
jgi:hypothetical protein